MKRTTNTTRTTFSKGCATALAAVLVCATVSLTPVEALAKEKPLDLKAVSATDLDVRSYHSTLGDYVLNMDIPEIQTNKDSALVKDTNRQIQKVVDKHLANAEKEFTDYKDSFFSTGGTKEDWADRTMYVIVDYDVKYNQKDILSLELTTGLGWVSFQEAQHFYNLDLKENKALTLEDLLGKDYVKICNDSITKQIKERLAADPSLMYFGFGADSTMEGGFKTITADTPFYLNSEGDVVISFPKYEIAPGAMGVQEFVIQK